MMDTTDTKAMIYRRTRAARVITALSILFLTAGLWMGVASAAQNTTSHRDRDDREDQLAAIKQITRDGAGSSEFRLSYLSTKSRRSGIHRGPQPKARFRLRTLRI
jgi:hypothetical protein